MKLEDKLRYVAASMMLGDDMWVEHPEMVAELLFEAAEALREAGIYGAV